MRREHIVVGGDDADIGRFGGEKNPLVGGGRGGASVGEIAARQAAATGGGIARAARRGRDTRRGVLALRASMRASVCSTTGFITADYGA